MTTSTNGNGNLIDEFEEAFEQCLGLFAKAEILGNNALNLPNETDESRVEVEQVILRFIDIARQVEAFFLQKRFLLSALKPELVVKEDINDLKSEVGRKEELIKRHYEKISVWQTLLAEMHSWVQVNGSQNHVVNSINNPVLSQHLSQHQQQVNQIHQHQNATGSPTANLQGIAVALGQQNMFVNQTVPCTRAPSYPVNVANNSTLQGPLALLEKTTSNIGMPERRS